MTDQPLHATSAASRQRGAVLFVSLIFLLALTMLGVMLARAQTTEERLAQNDANHDIAIEAAGATLRYAEMEIASGVYSNFAGDTAGLYTLDPTQGSVYTQAGASALWSNPAAVLTYSGDTQVSTPTTFIVEQLPQVGWGVPGASLGAAAQGYSGSGYVQLYQITAHSYGGDQTGNATLRSIYAQE